jgi:hypothetical protein
MGPFLDASDQTAVCQSFSYARGSKRRNELETNRTNKRTNRDQAALANCCTTRALFLQFVPHRCSSRTADVLAEMPPLIPLFRTHLASSPLYLILCSSFGAPLNWRSRHFRKDPKSFGNQNGIVDLFAQEPPASTQILLKLLCPPTQSQISSSVHPARTLWKWFS